MEKTISVEFKSPIIVTVKGKTDTEIIANAKKAVIETLSKKEFPKANYKVVDADSLTFEKALPGTIVEGEGHIGIIYKVSKRSIHVTYDNGASVYGPPERFKKSTKSFAEAKSERKLDDMYCVGDSGYLKVKDKFEPVIIGSDSRGSYKLHPINSKGEYYTASEGQMKLLFKYDL